MKMFALTTITAGALAATALGLAGTAAAAPAGPSSAADTVKSLQAEGYNVQLNGIVYGPPSECTVTGVHPDPTGTVNQAQFTTVYVDISCLSTG
jgi:hypothetical protein